jgi:plasmid stability protein
MALTTSTPAPTQQANSRRTKYAPPGMTLTSIYIDADVRDAVLARAKREGRTMAGVMRALLAEYLATEERPLIPADRAQVAAYVPLLIQPMAKAGARGANPGRNASRKPSPPTSSHLEPRR